MAIHKLENYLRMYRKRSGLSQDEVAYLLRAKSGSMNSRYERFRRKPSLETALAYEAIYGVPAKELFAGVAERAERIVRRRARILDKRMTAARRQSERLRSMVGEGAPNEEAKLAA
jgi:transcriptional regulator with XRE-family HTH domain